MGNPNDKEKQRDHFTSEFHKFTDETPGSLKDFTGALVLQPRNPNHRPDYYFWFGRTELVWKDVLHAKDPEGKLVRIKVPEEEVVCTGNVLVDAISIKNIDVPKLAVFLIELQQRQVREEEEWGEARMRRKRERRRRHQKRKRARKKEERQARSVVEKSDEDAARGAPQVAPQAGA